MQLEVLRKKDNTQIRISVWNRKKIHSRIVRTLCLRTRTSRWKLSFLKIETSLYDPTFITFYSFCIYVQKSSGFNKGPLSYIRNFSLKTIRKMILFIINVNTYLDLRVIEV